jgi:hypothetical protein
MGNVLRLHFHHSQHTHPSLLALQMIRQWRTAVVLYDLRKSILHGQQDVDIGLVHPARKGARLCVLEVDGRHCACKRRCAEERDGLQALPRVQLD